MFWTDPSAEYIAYAQGRIMDPRVRFGIGNACACLLPFPSPSFNGVVSGLVLNFISESSAAMAEMAGVARSKATMAAYVWDLHRWDGAMRRFWDAAVELDPAAQELDEGIRSAQTCRPEALVECFRTAGLHKAEARAFDVPTAFQEFDDD